MSKYQILYIDEQKDQRDEVVEKLSDDSFEVNAIHPYTSEEEMMSYIENEKFHAIIVDYGLMRSDKTIKYNGGDIINRINEIREEFPAFILTQSLDQDGEGVDDHVQPSMILMKKDLTDDDNLKSLKRKLEKFIILYLRKNDELSKELNLLIQKKSTQNGQLSDKENERLNYLDEKIELRLHGNRKFPTLLKDSESLKQLNSVLNEADKFLKQNLKK